ncbi:hypothetical protein [Rhizobium leguminosarum]|uniref:hypothetical protein n=1 Tax=Rhizobium leguminosarum TaxID=384 RepID=UPI0039655D2C
MAVPRPCGNVRILDRDKPIEIAGGYGIPEQAYQRLIDGHYRTEGHQARGSVIAIAASHDLKVVVMSDQPWKT